MLNKSKDLRLWGSGRAHERCAEQPEQALAQRKSALPPVPPANSKKKARKREQSALLEQTLAQRKEQLLLRQQQQQQQSDADRRRIKAVKAQPFSAVKPAPLVEAAQSATLSHPAAAPPPSLPAAPSDGEHFRIDELATVDPAAAGGSVESAAHSATAALPGIHSSAAVVALALPSAPVASGQLQLSLTCRPPALLMSEQSLILLRLLLISRLITAAAQTPPSAARCKYAGAAKDNWGKLKCELCWRSLAKHTASSIDWPPGRAHAECAQQPEQARARRATALPPVSQTDAVVSKRFSVVQLRNQVDAVQLQLEQRAAAARAITDSDELTRGGAASEALPDGCADEDMADSSAAAAATGAADTAAPQRKRTRDEALPSHSQPDASVALAAATGEGAKKKQRTANLIDACALASHGSPAPEQLALQAADSAAPVINLATDAENGSGAPAQQPGDELFAAQKGAAAAIIAGDAAELQRLIRPGVTAAYPQSQWAGEMHIHICAAFGCGRHDLALRCPVHLNFSLTVRRCFFHSDLAALTREQLTAVGPLQVSIWLHFAVRFRNSCLTFSSDRCALTDDRCALFLP